MTCDMGPGRPRIAAVIVTCDRPAELQRLLERIDAQSPCIADVIVVDNGQCERSAAICVAFGVHHLHSAINLGGAGGFALGILAALARGADFLWLWDDDGWPEADDCIGQQLAFQRASGAAIVSPLVIDADDPTRCAFAFRIRGRRIIDRAAMETHAVVRGMAHLFNGALMPAGTIHRFGLPDVRLFIRGDEVDFMLRVLRGGAAVATLTAAVARHPSGLREARPLFGGIFHACVPPDPLRREVMFRNRAHLARLHGRWRLLIADVVRYGLFFIARRRPDLRGFRHWLAATWDGLRGRLGRPGALPQARPLFPAAESDTAPLPLSIPGTAGSFAARGYSRHA